MMSSSSTPKLPKWIFFLADAVLLLTAWFIASRSPGPLSSHAIFAITACVIVGAILGTIPLLLHYEREKNETLDDRQRALEALALTLTTAADQISIAAKGLHEIAELTQKNLKQAEQLPQKLQDKVAEFQAQLGSTRDEERDEMKTELAALRAAESQRLESTVEKIQKAAGELAKLEAATQKTVAAAQAALAKTPETLTAATTAALMEIDARLAARTAAALASIAEASAKPPASTPPADDPGPPGGVERRKTPPRRSADVGQHITPVVPVTIAPFTGHIVSTDSASGEPVEQSNPKLATSGTAEVGDHIAPVVPPTAAPFAGHIISISPVPAEPAPVTTPAEPAIAPEPKSEQPTATASAGPVPTPDSPAVTEEAKPAKKVRAPRKPKPADGAGTALDLGIVEPAAAPAATDEFSQVAPDEAAAKVISSDGSTRLLVTAYIGIGNRLFVRGEGPGLSWDKGVPLQFVSIGKWRWESADATAPVKYKLYKNDEIECTALGIQTVDPAHQQEVTATF
jgi:hypothetical protein